MGLLVQPLLVLCFSAFLFNRVTSQNNTGSIEGTVLIGAASAIGRTDEDFICATLDWWPPEKCDYGTCSWGRSSLLNLDLSNTILFNAIKAFSPLKLRLGGSLQDKVIYEDEQPCVSSFIHNTSEMFSFTQGCLPMSRWDQLSDFFGRTGAVVIFGLNALNGRVPTPDTTWVGPWNSSNAAALIRYTVNKGYTVHGWELGNELSGSGVGAKVGADQYAADVIALRYIIDEIYAGSSSSGDLIGKILSPSSLDGEAATFRNLQSLLQSAGTKTTAWVGEAGGAYNSGHNLVTNAFVFSFWYLDQLGMASTYDTKTYCRQSFIGGNYGLLSTTNFEPNPDYYSALLWHRLMGRNVLSTNFSETENLRTYAHCAKQSLGITLLLLNLDGNTTVKVSVSTDSTLKNRPASLLLFPSSFVFETQSPSPTKEAEVQSDASGSKDGPKARQFETVVETLNEMGRERVLEIGTFKIAIKAFAAAREVKKAIGVFELIKRYDLDAGIETSSYLLNCIAQEKLAKETQEVFVRMRERLQAVVLLSEFLFCTLFIYVVDNEFAVLVYVGEANSDIESTCFGSCIVNKF
ncbi:Heparanase-like protein 3 [Acorus calamus]|uniref:Heparanase-like protein 3 n=1 Tax=Acorus calamus TaxID=4465 RepID=A0AAV9FAT9_ACOCL|nr:Heparanase-like protein 3 [Acorus calamus]